MDKTHVKSKCNDWRFPDFLIEGKKTMAAPHCGICGSIDVIMDGSGLFVCQDCGARFTLEAMRNLMREEVLEPYIAKNTEEKDTKDAEPGFHWGDADSDLLVEYCESGAFDLAASVWKRLETREEPVHPWVVLQGKIACEMIDINDESFKSGRIYRDYVDAYKSYYVDTRMRGALDIHALQILEIAGNTIATEQKRILGILTSSKNESFVADEYVKVLGYKLSATLSADIDHACYVAIIDVAGCIGRGYLPSSKEWNELSRRVTKMKAINYYPLVKRIYERLLGIVSQGSIPANLIEKSIGDGALSLVDSARASWGTHDYDIAIRAYEQLSEDDNRSISLEAQVARYLYGKYSLSEFARYEWFVEDYNKKMAGYFSDACIMDGSEGIRLCERFVILSAILNEMASHMTSCAAAYLSSDFDQANNCRESAERLLGLVKYSYKMFCDCVSKILSRSSNSLGEEDYSHLKTVLNLFPETAKNAEWYSAMTDTKNCYFEYLRTDSSFLDEVNTMKDQYQTELAEVRGELTPLKADYDKLGAFALRKKDSIRKLMAPLQQREQDLLQTLNMVEKDSGEVRWNGLH